MPRGHDYHLQSVVDDLRRELFVHSSPRDKELRAQKALSTFVIVMQDFGIYGSVKARKMSEPQSERLFTGISHIPQNTTKFQDLAQVAVSARGQRLSELFHASVARKMLLLSKSLDRERRLIRGT